MKKNIFLMIVLLLGWSVVRLSAEEIRVSVTYYSAKTEVYFKEAARAFEKANPRDKVKIEVVGWDNMLQKLITDLSANRSPDIAIIGTRWLLDFVDQDVVEPLDSYMSSKVKDRFIKVFLQPSVLKGKTYGLPIAASSRAMYYNKDLFKKAGIKSPPDTWEELRVAARKISKLKDVYGFGLQGKEIDMDGYWYYILWSFGGDLIQNGKSGIGSSAAIKAAAFYKSLIDEKLTQPGVTSYSREDVQNLFKKGKVGMMMTGPFLINQIKQEAPNLNYGVAMIPKQKKRATYGVTDSIIMFKSSKHKELAFSFLDFIFTDEWRAKFTKNEGFLPVNKTVAQDDYFVKDANRRSFTGMLPFAHFAPTVVGWEEAVKIISDSLQKIYLGSDPGKELKAASKKMSRVLR